MGNKENRRQDGRGGRKSRFWGIWIVALLLSAFLPLFAQTVGVDYASGKESLVSALEDFKNIGKPKSAENASEYTELYRDARNLFKDSLSDLTGSTPPEKESVSASFLLIYAAQALRGMDAIIQGVENSDKQLTGNGWGLFGFAYADISRLTGKPETASSKAASAKTQARAAAPGQWKRSINWGLNSSLMSTSDLTSFSLGGSAGPQINRNLDTGVSLNIQRYTPKEGDGATSVLTSFFGRWSFINAFPAKPEVVPYGGLSLGYRTSSGDSSIVLGIPFGALWYFSRTKALTFGMEFQKSLSGATKTSTFLMNVGIRFSTPFPNDGAAKDKSGVKDSMIKTSPKLEKWKK